MSQMGMQMPGAHRSRKPVLNIYTGMSFVAMIAVLIATIFVYSAAAIVAPEEGLMAPLKLHEAGRDIRNLPNVRD
ncbi:MAG: hypothetical protein ACNA8P_00745 [Phycisphaerales bacterium]